VHPSPLVPSSAPARPAPEPAEWERLTSQAREYLHAAKSDATLRADWRHFEAWCRQKGFSPLPAAPDTVAIYLGETAAIHRPPRSPAA
jgi:hypothetical protein